MATIAFVWELGGGLGHLSQMFPLAAALAQRGHRVAGIFRDVPGAARAFGQIGAQLYQAPARLDARIVIPDAAGFGQFLANMGFWDRDELAGLSEAWRNLFALIRPDLIIFDHSPMALLAARGMECRKIAIGSGFCCPPDVFPLPRIRREGAGGARHEYSSAAIEEHEQKVVERVNAVLKRAGARPLERLGQLYGEVDQTFLTTFAELDHYGQRPEARYWGPINGVGGRRPRWPAGEGKRIFAYLKAFDGLEALLGALHRLERPTIIYSRWINARMQRRFGSAAMCFEEERLDMSIVGRECDMGILHGGHGATCDLLLSGKPILEIPLNPEQRLIADAVKQIGAGETVASDADEAAFEVMIQRVMGEESYGDAAAERFARRHGDFDREKQLDEMVERAGELFAET